jgi:hypothetical protein
MLWYPFLKVAPYKSRNPRSAILKNPQFLDNEDSSGFLRLTTYKIIPHHQPFDSIFTVTLHCTPQHNTIVAAMSDDDESDDYYSAVDHGLNGSNENNRRRIALGTKNRQQQK